MFYDSLELIMVYKDDVLEVGECGCTNFVLKERV